MAGWRGLWLALTIQLLIVIICDAFHVTKNEFDEDIVTLPLEKRPYTRRRLQSPGYRTVGFTKREADGVYYTTIRIGTPLQSFTVIVDTGSSTIAVPCKGCDCGDHNHFDPDASSTVERTGTRYNQCYSEGSCNSGQVLTDLACFGETCMTNETVRHRFGCCETYARAFKQQEADGIVGLSGSPDTLIAYLRKQYNLRKDMFALCFGRRGGSLTVGGVFHRPWREDPMWVPLASSSMFYSVVITKVNVGDVTIDAPSNLPMPIIDSGSTFTYFPYQVHDQSVKAFNDFCNKGGNRCKGTRNPLGTPAEDVRDAIACFAPPDDVTNIDKWLVDSFPTIAIMFGEKKLCIPPPTYFFLSRADIRSYCVGILKDRKFVLGAVTMSDFSVIFDHTNNQVGFVRSDCDENREVTCCSKKCPGTTFQPPTIVSPSDATRPPVPDESNKDHDGNDDGLEKPDPRLTPPDHVIVPTKFESKARMGPPFFFILGIIIALICAFGFWLCCPSGSGSLVGNSSQVETPRRVDFQKLPTIDDDTESLTRH